MRNEMASPYVRNSSSRPAGCLAAAALTISCWHGAPRHGSISLTPALSGILIDLRDCEVQQSSIAIFGGCGDS